MPGALVLNVGDMLMRWSNGLLRSAVHRVGVPPALRVSGGEEEERGGEDGVMVPARFSIPFFLSSDPETLIECLPECVDEANPTKYEPVLQREYGQLRGRLHYREKKE